MKLNTFWTLILVLAIAAWPLQAQCPAGQTDLNDLVDDFLGKTAEKKAAEEVSPRDVALGVIEAPLAVGRSTQAGAPSSLSASSGTVDGASFTEFFSLAVDNKVVSGDENALTINFTPFVLPALANHDNYWQQDLYEKKEALRRVGATVSLGGKGDSFDRDGDGKADQALETDSLGDIVTWELRYRFYGSRDRRDRDNFEVFRDEIVTSAKGHLLRQYLDLKGQLIGRIIANLDPDGDGCATQAALESAVAAIGGAEELAVDSKAAFQQLGDAYEAAGKRVDKSLIWTLVVGGTDREAQFGPDKQMVAIRGAREAHTWNLEWSRSDSLTSAPDPEMFKLAWEYSLQVLRGTVGKDGAKLSGGFSYETFDNVPSAKHDTNSKLSAKLELPFGSDGVTLPISVTWANHKDLLSDDDEVVAHFGFQLDTSKLFEKSWLKNLLGGSG